MLVSYGPLDDLDTADEQTRLARERGHTLATSRSSSSDSVRQREPGTSGAHAAGAVPS